MSRNFHVALLRGINVGRAKRVAMADLRGLVEQLGFGDVRTVLNSGNVVFSAHAGTAADAGARIEAALAGSLGVKARVTVVSAAELARIVAENPLAEAAAEPSRFLVVVLNDPALGAKVEPLLRQDWAPDVLAFAGRAAYVWCRGGILESRLAQTIGRLLGDASTSRNWATILKLHALTTAGA